MATSILNGTKKALNIASDDTAFDQDVVMHINGSLAELQQLGIGPEDGFVIEDDTKTWDDFITEDSQRHIRSMAAQYVYFKAVLAFDPPQIGYLIDLKKKQIEEAAFRLTIAREEILNALEV